MKFFLSSKFNLSILSLCALFSTHLFSECLRGSGPITIGGPYGIKNINHFCLCNNVLGPITIASSFVTLDLNGYSITGGQHGIIIAPGVHHISIKNGLIFTNHTPASGSGIYVHGAPDKQCYAISIENVTVSGNAPNDILDLSITGWEHGIFLTNSYDILLNNCIMLWNTNGLKAELCRNIIAKNCYAKTNGHAGFWLIKSIGNNFTNCNVFQSRSKTDAFGFLSEGCIGNTFTLCSTEGIESASMTSDNLAAGFRLSKNESLSNITQCTINHTLAPGNARSYGILLDASQALTPLYDEQNLGYSVDSVAWLPATNTSPAYLAASIRQTYAPPSNPIVKLYKVNYSLDQATYVVTPVSSSVITNMYNSAKLAWISDNSHSYLAIIGLMLGEPESIIDIYSLNRDSGNLTYVNRHESRGLFYSITTLLDKTGNLVVGGFDPSTTTGILSAYSMNMNDGTINLVDQINITNGSIVSVDSTSITGNVYIAASGPSNQLTSSFLQIYQLNDNGSLILVCEKDDINAIISATSFGPEQFIACCGQTFSATDGFVNIYRLNTDTKELSQSDSKQFTGFGKSLSFLKTSTPYLSILIQFQGFSQPVELNTYAFNLESGTLDDTPDFQTTSNGTTAGACSWLLSTYPVIATGTSSTFGILDMYELIEPTNCTVQYNNVFGTQGNNAIGVSGNNFRNLIIRNTAYNNTLNYASTMLHVHKGYTPPTNSLDNIALQ